MTPCFAAAYAERPETPRAPAVEAMFTAVAAPMPLLAPVTTATLPSSGFVVHPRDPFIRTSSQPLLFAVNILKDNDYSEISSRSEDARDAERTEDVTPARRPPPGA